MGIVADIHSLNRAYLVVLRDAVKSDLPQACASFGINTELAERISGMSLADISLVSETNQVLFRTTLTPETLGTMPQLSDMTQRSVLAALTGT